MQPSQKYSFGKSLLKLAIKGGILVIPFAFTLLPKEWLNITLGSALYLLLDYIQKVYTTF